MNNFNIYNPVELVFGGGCLDKLPKALGEYGKKVLLIYGKSSIKESGLYDKLKELLKDFDIVEYAGIKSNPLVEDADAAAKLAREKQVDVILAVGGGSVIDTAKMVSVGAYVEHSVWDFMIGESKPQQACPLVSVLTLAATGTEMNPYAVLQNHVSKQKIGYGHDLTYPKKSFLDPQLTTTVDAKYTAYGIVDLIAHSLEAYFGAGDAPLSDKFVYAIIEEAMEVSSALLRNLHNYELRARVMYAATMALNGTVFHGRKSGDWGVHSIGHELSLLFDMPHGASLSIAYPAWMRLMAEEAGDRIVELGSALFGAQDVEETVVEFEAFFTSIGSPVRLSEYGIGEAEHQKIVEQYQQNRVGGAHHRISAKACKQLVKLMA